MFAAPLRNDCSPTSFACGHKISARHRPSGGSSLPRALCKPTARDNSCVWPSLHMTAPTGLATTRSGDLFARSPKRRDRPPQLMFDRWPYKFLDLAGTPASLTAARHKHFCGHHADEMTSKLRQAVMLEACRRVCQETSVAESHVRRRCLGPMLRCCAHARARARPPRRARPAMRHGAGGGAADGPQP